MSTTVNSAFGYIYKARLTLIDLLARQGFDVSAYNGFSRNQLDVMIKEKQLDMYLTNNNITKKKLFVKWQNILSKTLRWPNIESIIDEVYEQEDMLSEEDSLLIISNDDPNDTVIASLRSLFSEKNIHVNVISLKRLQYNILDHNLVPPHRILQNKEKEEIIDKYKIIDNKQLPEISRYDPVSVAINMRPGDICEIIRPSKTAILTKYYRYCIN
jgi:DNA-directed RNA polymerase subunit H (RpoH/RPB5)